MSWAPQIHVALCSLKNKWSFRVGQNAYPGIHLFPTGVELRKSPMNFGMWVHHSVAQTAHTQDHLPRHDAPKSFKSQEYCKGEQLGKRKDNTIPSFRISRAFDICTMLTRVVLCDLLFPHCSNFAGFRSVSHDPNMSVWSKMDVATRVCPGHIWLGHPKMVHL